MLLFGSQIYFVLNAESLTKEIKKKGIAILQQHREKLQEELSIISIKVNVKRSQGFQ